MEKAYIILAHKQPEQLYRLIKKLDDGSSSFFVHIDKNKEITDFNNLADFKDRLKLVEREASNWGEIGIVKAILNALTAIQKSDKQIEHIILLSGQDYPIKSNEYINRFLTESKYGVFIEYWDMPNFKIWKNRGGMFRNDKYFIGMKKHQQFLSKSMNLMARFLPLIRRKMPYNLKPFGGWMWWSIDKYALNYILQYLKDHPGYLKYHRFTFIPDEIFFQTILLNAKDEKLTASILNNNMRYITWKEGKSHPETFTKKDLGNIMQSDALFARKFDTESDKEILDMIDKNCLGN